MLVRTDGDGDLFRWEVTDVKKEKKKFTHMVILTVKINVGLAKGLWVLRVSELGTIRVRKKSKDYTLMLTQTTKTIHVIYSIHIILFL